MTSFDSLSDLLTFINTIENDQLKLIIGKQEITPDPDMLYTLVIYYTDLGVFMHESNVEDTPGNADIVKAHQEIFKSLDIHNSDIVVTREPEIRVKALPEDKNLIPHILNIDLDAVKD